MDAFDDEKIDVIGRRMSAAVRAGNADEVRGILLKCPEELTAFPGMASSWLHFAADKGQIGVIDVFLKAGLDINWERSSSGGTPLEGAVDFGQYETTKHLLSRGANPKIGRCLIGAINAESNSFELVKLLVENGIDVNQYWRFGDEEHGPIFNALSWAINAERQDIADYLRANGAVMPPEEPRPPYSTPSEEILAYYEQRFGRVDPRALREIFPTSPDPIIIHRIPPTDDRDSIILFTTGMSDQPMAVPEGEEEYQYAELLIELPSGWPLDKADLADPNRRWPIDWLRRVAAYPSAERTWLGGPVAIMANAEPPEPFSPNCKFTAMLIIAGYSDVGPIILADSRKVQGYTLVPLYENERELAQSEGLPELFRRLDEFGIGRKVDLSRQNVVSL